MAQSPFISIRWQALPVPVPEGFVSVILGIPLGIKVPGVTEVTTRRLSLSTESEPGYLHDPVARTAGRMQNPGSPSRVLKAPAPGGGTAPVCRARGLRLCPVSRPPPRARPGTRQGRGSLLWDGRCRVLVWDLILNTVPVRGAYGPTDFEVTGSAEASLVPTLPCPRANGARASAGCTQAAPKRSRRGSVRTSLRGFCRERSGRCQAGPPLGGN